MTCLDCIEKGLRGSVLASLQQIAANHGFELWTRPGVNVIEVLVVPTGASHGSAQDVFLAFNQIGMLPTMPPSQQRAQAARMHTFKPDSISLPGRSRWKVQGGLPIELVFIDALM